MFRIKIIMAAAVAVMLLSIGAAAQEELIIRGDDAIEIVMDASEGHSEAAVSIVSESDGEMVYFNQIKKGVGNLYELRVSTKLEDGFYKWRIKEYGNAEKNCRFEYVSEDYIREKLSFDTAEGLKGVLEDEAAVRRLGIDTLYYKGLADTANYLAFMAENTDTSSYDKFIKSYNDNETVWRLRACGGKLDLVKEILLQTDIADNEIYKNMSDTGKNAVYEYLADGGLTAEDLNQGVYGEILRCGIVYFRAGEQKRITDTLKAETFAETAERAGTNLPSVYSDFLKLTEVKQLDVVSGVISKIDKNTNLEEFFDIMSKEMSSSAASGRLPSGGGSGGGATVYAPAEASTKQETAKKTVFSDVGSEFSWALPHIEKLTALGVINGKTADTFAPKDYIKREEFVKIVCLALKCSEYKQETDFTDVSASDWFAPYVYAAYEQGIVTGYDDKSFGTGRNITREDIAVIISRLLKNAGISCDESGTAFKDLEEVSDYAKESVAFVSALGIVSGDDEGRFNPGDFATRAEAVKMIGLTVELLDKQKY